MDDYQMAGPIQANTALYRIAFLGATGVGKSTLASQYLFGKSRSDHIPTIEDIYT
jgi:GTPase SAR1 family protein